MLYKFRSRAAADLIMLEPQAQQILRILGKEPGPTGIITGEQIPAAIAALEAAVRADENRRSTAEPEPAEDDDDESARDPVRLRQRVAPFIDMLRRTAAEGYDLVWGA